MSNTLIRGDALDLIQQFDKKIDLMVTDPPYAFGGSGDERLSEHTEEIEEGVCLV